jgi:hypothetical protein
MKWKLKALAAAIALAVSAPASAAIVTSGGNGELFFNAWDPVSKSSYTRDLGVLMNDFVPGGILGSTSSGYSLTFAADATLTSWLSSVASNIGSVLWNIGAIDSVTPERYLTTAGSIAATSFVNSQLTAMDAANGFITPTNSLGTHPTLTNGSNTASEAANGNSAYAGGGFWGSNWGNKTPFSTAALVGESNFFWLLAQNGTSTLTSALKTQFGNADGASTWSFGSDGTLAFNSAAPAAIPVPAAVWLLGSGLLGLAGIARRRQMKLA